MVAPLLLLRPFGGGPPLPSEAPAASPILVAAARAYVHAPYWPYHRIGELTTAHNIDRAWSLMQPGIAALNIAREELDRDVVRTGNLLIIESARTAPWVGYMLIAEEDLGGGYIEINGLEMSTGLDARSASADDAYEASVSSGSVFRQLVSNINSRAHIGLFLQSNIDAGATVEDIDLAAQTALSALDELAERTGNEWWVDYSVRPQRVEATLHWGIRQGADLSGEAHLYEGRHYVRFTYRQDATRVQESATAYGGGGVPSARQSVTQTAGAYRGSFGGVFEAASAAAVRTIADLPPGLRTERVVLTPATTSEAELSREARQALEKPLGAAEQFSIVVNGYADWRQLALGNFITVHADMRLRDTSRKVRIVGVQPDEESGICELVVEVVR